jgi:hypothetical protein
MCQSIIGTEFEVFPKLMLFFKSVTQNNAVMCHSKTNIWNLKKKKKKKKKTYFDRSLGYEGT